MRPFLCALSNQMNDVGTIFDWHLKLWIMCMHKHSSHTLITRCQMRDDKKNSLNHSISRENHTHHSMCEIKFQTEFPTRHYHLRKTNTKWKKINEWMTSMKKKKRWDHFPIYEQILNILTHFRHIHSTRTFFFVSLFCRWKSQNLNRWFTDKTLCA